MPSQSSDRIVARSPALHRIHHWPMAVSTQVIQDRSAYFSVFVLVWRKQTPENSMCLLAVLAS
jgi:hypothetical protein